MKCDDTNSVRELTDDDIVSVAAGILGAIPGYRSPGPSSDLFRTPSVVCASVGGSEGGFCWFTY